jgi:hypothetical protein
MNALDKLILDAVRCVRCGARYGECDCWSSREATKPARRRFDQERRSPSLATRRKQMLPQEKEKESESAPRIPGAFRPGDPIPEQPTMPGATGKTVDDEPDHDKARETELAAGRPATAVEPMKSTDLKRTDKPTETDRPGEKDKPDYHGKVRATRDDSHKSHR